MAPTSTRTHSAHVDPARDAPAGAEPTHPRWTHLPIGAVLLVAVFDVVSRAGGSEPWAHELYRAGTFGLLVASPAMVLAITTGLIDRARIVGHRDVRTQVNKHAVLMALMAGASAVDLALRRLIHPDAQRTPAIVLAFTLLAVVISVVGGDRGGRLTYRLGVGVRSRRPRQEDGSDG